MNLEVCKRYMTMLEKETGASRNALDYLEKILSKASAEPTATFLAGLHVSAMHMQRESPLDRMTQNPTSRLLEGMLLGICLAAASGDPDLIKLLDASDKGKENVTPINFARGFKP